MMLKNMQNGLVKDCQRKRNGRKRQEGLIPESIRGEDECSFLNTNFSDWIEENGVSSKELWEEDEPHELWNARLFPVSSEPAETIRLSLTLQNKPHNPVVHHSVDEWKAAPRMSLEGILNSIDSDRLLRSYFEINQKTKLRNITRTLTSDNDLSSEEILSWCHDREDYETLLKVVTGLIEQSDNLFVVSSSAV